MIHFSWPQGLTGALTTSWDDGTIYDRELIPILNQFGLKGTFNLNSGKFGLSAAQSGWKEYVRADEVFQLYSGHEVAVHTVNHPHLTGLSDAGIQFELLEDRRALEALVGYPVCGMAYPFGVYDQRVMQIAREADFVYSRGVKAGEVFALPDDFLQWTPTCHFSADLRTLWKNFLAAKTPDKLFYLWGHSYEFAEQNNWQIIKDFAEMTASTPGIWHAANFQVYEYLKAWQDLEISSDGKVAHNPSRHTVWARQDQRLIELPPGDNNLL